MVCMSAPVTSRIIDSVVDDYNVDVLFWADELKQHFKVYIVLMYWFTILILSLIKLSSNTVSGCNLQEYAVDGDIEAEGLEAEGLEAEVFEAESESDAESCCSDCSSLVSPEWEPVEVDEDDAAMETEALDT